MNYLSQGIRMMLRLGNVAGARNIARSECSRNNPGTKKLNGVATHDLCASAQLVIAPARIIVGVLGVGTAEDEVIESATGTSRLIWRREIFFNGKRNRIKSALGDLIPWKCRSNVVPRITGVGDSSQRVVYRQQGARSVISLREVAALLWRRWDAGGYHVRSYLP